MEIPELLDGNNLDPLAEAWLEIERLKQRVAELEQQSAKSRVQTQQDSPNSAAVRKKSANKLYESERRAAVMEERTRIARGLHDSLQQDLYGIELGIIAAQKLLRHDKEKVEAQLGEILLTAEGALNELRSLIFDLRPDALQNTGLVVGLSNYITTLRTRHRLEVESTISQEPPVPLEVKEAFYWITREALQNVVKHSRATRVVLSLYWDKENGQARLEIRDNGIGFEQAAANPGHYGFSFIQNRADEAGVRLEISSKKDGSGTAIRTFWP